MGGFTRRRSEASPRGSTVYGFFRASTSGPRDLGLSLRRRAVGRIGCVLDKWLRLVMLDEPSPTLAPQIIDGIFETIVTLNREEKLTVLLIEQNAQLALEVAPVRLLSSRTAASSSTAPPKKLRANDDVQEFTSVCPAARARACAT